MLYRSVAVCIQTTQLTTAALVALRHTVCDMLLTNNFVHVIALDFSKAFDSVCHSTLMENMVQLDVLEQAYTAGSEPF